MGEERGERVCVRWKKCAESLAARFGGGREGEGVPGLGPCTTRTDREKRGKAVRTEEEEEEEEEELSSGRRKKARRHG